MEAHRTERGQALVLIVLAIGAIFGFAALALDVGQIYSARRKAQNAADAAALAAAYDAVQGSLDRDQAVSKGFSIAAVNGFNNDGVTNWVVVNNPPIGGPYCFPCTQDPTKYEYYQVKITVKTSPIFAQLLYQGAERTTVEAVAHATGPGTVSAGDAIHSLSKEDTSMNLDGDVTVNVKGGNIRSNGGMVKKGGSGSVDVQSPGKVYYDSTFAGHSEVITPGPTQDTGVRVGSMKPPACPTAAEAASWPKVGAGKNVYYKNTFAYKAGTPEAEAPVDYYYYPDGLIVQDLPPGIHCIDGGIPGGNYTGDDVLLVLLSGTINQTGNDSVDLRAAADIIDRNGTQWGGMVFYAPPSNTNELKFGGNSATGESYFYGTVYAPGALCDIGGTSDGREEHTAIVCDLVKFHGNPHLNIYYDPAELFHFPPMVEIVQ